MSKPPIPNSTRARSAAASSASPAFTQTPRYRPNWIAAATCFVAGLWLLVALLDYAPAQSSCATTDPIGANLAGRWGANTTWVLLYTLGASTWLVPLFLLWMLYVSLRNARHLAATRLTAIALCLLSLSGLAAMLQSISPSDYFPEGPGGWVGALLYTRALHGTLGPFGAALLLGTLYLGGLLFIFTKDVGAEINRYLAAFQIWRETAALRRAERAEARRLLKEDRAKEKAAAAEAKAELKAQIAALKKGSTKPKAAASSAIDSDEADSEQKARIADQVSAAVAAATKTSSAPETKGNDAPPALARGKKSALENGAAASSATNLDLKIVQAEEIKKVPVSIPQSDDADYRFPDIALLSEQVTDTPGNSREEHQQNAENLLRILGDFGVTVRLGEIHVGPVITRYEVEPGTGVRVEKIAGLDKNIALGMRAQSVRILAPIPGKAAVGVEVPNKHATPVGIREIIESEDWARVKAELPIALGKDVSGKPLISDLTKMPHLLIAGATGSGKSVCINAIVASILYSKSPRDVRLLMVDPKVVELKIFNTLPHMLIPVVTEPKKVPAALKWLLGEMEQRYQLFAKCNVRNILGFNNRKKDAPLDPVEAAARAQMEAIQNGNGADEAAEISVPREPSAEEQNREELPEKLPYIVAIVDELADLMMVAPAEIETSIARLAQLARAAGIHLIIATQRPSVNVITGVIKANLPSRIAFQVASQVDSRTILDTKGADNLIGRGDMLFSPPGSSRLVRAQGAFVSDDEVIAIVDALKVNGPPRYATSVQQQIDRAASDGDDDGESDYGDLGEDSELFAQALDVLRSTKRASTSMIQRRLRIGYNRAARIMDLMEDKGIIGPENGSSPRDILVDLDSYEG
ncbi:cell division protein FtsK [Cephaloticoccus capnophilus]|uniref:Cell division protein FtsK n=1 Tax=Cephaloticoccus capnophilus TaxID=1548208 RepID=A0A139SLG6_9BACT|nr:DNA translocase FtsK [Cephaloticoccus capnophilus]KXU35398.1 cell division protein FtsK [Cephaloticoccus capnophilus]